MNALAERAREGNLTTEEAAQLDSYLHVGSLLSLRVLPDSVSPLRAPFQTPQHSIIWQWLVSIATVSRARTSRDLTLLQGNSSVYSSPDRPLEEHFRFGGARLVGLTPIGRATIHVLAMNADDLLLFRTEILHEGRLVGSLAKRKRRGGEE